MRVHVRFLKVALMLLMFKNAFLLAKYLFSLDIRPKDKIVIKYIIDIEFIDSNCEIIDVKLKTI